MSFLNVIKFLLILFTFFCLTSCEKKDQEQVVTAKEVPQEVLQAFNQAYPGAAIKEYAEETEFGLKFYEISCEFEGRIFDVIYKPDGTVNAVEEVIPNEALPEIIHKAITKEFNQFSISLVEKIEKEGQIFYEVQLINIQDQKKYELQYSDLGELLEKEVKNKEKNQELDNVNNMITVPVEINSAFNTKFSGATDITWGKESDIEYEAEFKLNGKLVSANFDTSGKCLVTETKLTKEELPTQITNNLKSQFGEYQVIEAESLEKTGKPVVFEVMLEMGETTLEVVLESNWKIVK